jgi:hypothetical protein
MVIDTSQPTIVPSLTLVEDAVPGEPSPLQSYASTTPPPTVTDVDQKKRKVINRQGRKVAAYRPPLESTPVAASGGSANTGPLTKLSFMDIISGGAKKPIQPALKPRLVDGRRWPGQFARLSPLVLERVCVQQSELRVASWREIQYP